MKKRRNRGKNGKTVGNGSISKTRNSGRISVIWLLLAVVVAVSLTVGACALWLPDRAPALLGSAKEITSAPAGVQEYTGATRVTMIPTVSQTRELVGNASGTVTEDMSSQGLTSGKTAMKVNGVSVVALATATPMYRDLATGDKGDDVLALNNELARLGLPASAKSTTYTWNTSQGVKQLMSAAGNTSDGSLPLTDVLWIPAASVRVNEWAGTVGATVAGGSVVGKVPGSVTKFSIQNGQPSELDRTVTLIGQTATLKAGTTEVDDAEFCAKVAATQEFQSLTSDMLATGLEASVQLVNPVQALRVPAASVIGVNGSKGCIVSGGKTIKVSIVGSELGASLVEPQGADAAAITSVEIGSGLTGESCR